MADFAEWATAAEFAFGWPAGTVLRAYKSNQASANVLVLESSLLVAPLKKMNLQRPWTGTATQLLRLLKPKTFEAKIQRDWPKNGQVLSTQLRRIAPNLREIGIDVQIGAKTGGSGSKRLITIRRLQSAATSKPKPGPDGIVRFPRLNRDARDASDADRMGR